MNLDPAKQELIDYNYVLCMGLLTSNTVSGEFLNSYKYSIFNTGVPNRQFNVFFVKEKTSNPLKLVQKAEQFFGRLPFRVSFKQGLEREFLHLLSERGYKENPPETVMTLFNLPDGNSFRKNLDINRVSSAEELSHFQEVVEKSYSLPPGSGSYVVTGRILNLPDAELFVGYAENQPACTSMLIKTGPVAGIYWVATLDRFRNHGFGKAITVSSLVAGRKRGCTFASLQASAMGKPVYQRIGFDNPYDYHNFSSPDS